MRQYIDLVRDVLHYGMDVEPWREGVPGSRELFGKTMRFNLQDGFPILTTKKVFFRGVVAELLWFLRGDTNIDFLHNNGVHIWDNDTYRFYKERTDSKVSKEEWVEGSIPSLSKDKVTGNPHYSGKIYGYQWRMFGDEFDQIHNLVKNLKEKPHSRRHVVTAWNPIDFSDKYQASLPACHVMFICNVNNDGYLNMMVIQRSCDLFLGVPFNISSYSLLIHILCLLTGYKPGVLTWVGGSVHIYNNHIKIMERQMLNYLRQLPEIDLTIPKEKLLMADGDLDKFIDSLEVDDFKLVNYQNAGILKVEQYG